LRTRGRERKRGREIETEKFKNRVMRKRELKK
jgi:hypothetical protein